MQQGRSMAGLKDMANRMRRTVLELANAAGANGAHIGSALSIIEITSTLYGKVMSLDPANPQWDGRDRFILSKGHGALGYYTALAEVGYITPDELRTYESNGGFLAGQPSLNPGKGIEFASGSLGMGLSQGVGVALAAKSQEKLFDTYVLMGDGECNEGTVWEAAMTASHFKLDNLVAIIDKNDLQSDGASMEILDMLDMKQKWLSFGWEVVEVDGHDIGALCEAFTSLRSRGNGKPYAVIANTVKGKGVSFMENNNQWHHSRLTNDQLAAALAELAELTDEVRI